MQTPLHAVQKAAGHAAPAILATSAVPAALAGLILSACSPSADKAALAPQPVVELSQHAMAQATTVDGDLSEWAAEVSTPVSKLVIGAGTVDVAHYGYRATEQGLYVAVKVEDDAVVVHDASHESDSVELYLNGDNITQGDPSAPSWALPGMGPDELQFAIAADGTGARAYKSGSLVAVPADIQMASQAHTDHVAVEFFVPWTRLNTSLTQASSTGLGFDIGINDCDAGTTRSRQVMWNGSVNNWRDPNQWGSITPQAESAGALAVDGSLGDWGSGGICQSAGKVVDGPAPADPISFGYQATEEGLFVGVRISDDTVNVHDSSHLSDSVELYLNGDNITQGDPSAPSWALPGMGPDEVQFTVGADGSGARAYKSGSLVAIPAGVLMAGTTHSDHTAFEFFVPWNVLNTNYSTALTTGVGFDVGVNDSDSGTTRLRQVMWNGSVNNWRDPNYWGAIRLSHENPCAGDPPSNELPSGLLSTDIGSSGQTGSAADDAGTLTIIGGGFGIDGASDSFQFTAAPLSGDGQITAKIESISSGNPDGKAGLMIRDGLAADAPNAFMALYPYQGSTFQYRTSASGSTLNTWIHDSGRSLNRSDNIDNIRPYRTRFLRPSKWLKMVRQGNAITAYSSDDGLCWNVRWTESISFTSSDIQAGIAVTASDTSQTATVTATNVEVTGVVPDEINENCARYLSDNDVAPPTEWIVPPGRFAPSTWDYTTVNPNPWSARPVSCLEGSFRRRYNPDDPICPAETTDAPWALAGYNYDSTWILNAPGGFGHTAAASGAGTQLYTNDLWLRKEITLTAEQIDQIMFYGFWDNSVSIFVNGVLATNIYKGNFPNKYHHLGLNSTARSALVEGVNVIAVRVSRESFGFINVDFGIGLNAQFANLPRTVGVSHPAYPQFKARADAVYEYALEQGSIGGVVAFADNDLVVEDQAFGYKDIALSEPMPASAILRLASVDKLVTQAIIVKLYQEGLLDPDAKVFGPTGILSHVQPWPGFAPGNRTEDITVDQLRLHRSGITQQGGGIAWQDEVAFRFGIPSSDLGAAHLLSTFYTFDTAFEPGVFEAYNSNGFAVLRLIAEHVTGMPLNDYLATEMNAPEIVVAYERLEDKHPKEPSYQIIGREMRARWFELENYRALSASARDLATFIPRYAPYYIRNGDIFEPSGGGIGGAMDGTRSAGYGNPFEGEGNVFIYNSDLAGSSRLNDQLSVLQRNLNPGTCDPTTNPSAVYRINSALDSAEDLGSVSFVHIEDTNGNGIWPLQYSTAQESWVSARWRFEATQEAGQTYYRIINAFNNSQALHLEELVTDPQNGGLSASDYQAGWQSAQWILEEDGAAFKLRNRFFADRYINLAGGALQATPGSGNDPTARWYICN